MSPKSRRFNFIASPPVIRKPVAGAPLGATGHSPRRPVESNLGIPQIRAYFIQGYAACPVTGSSRERYLRGEAQVQIVPQQTRKEVLVSIFAKDLLEYFK